MLKNFAKVASFFLFSLRNVESPDFRALGYFARITLVIYQLTISEIKLSQAAINFKTAVLYICWYQVLPGFIAMNMMSSEAKNFERFVDNYVAQPELAPVSFQYVQLNN